MTRGRTYRQLAERYLHADLAGARRAGRLPRWGRDERHVGASVCGRWPAHPGGLDDLRLRPADTVGWSDAGDRQVGGHMPIPIGQRTIAIGQSVAVQVPTGRSIRRWAGSTALAIYGGTAWIGCLVGGVLIGALVHDWPDDGTTMGRSHSLAAAFPEIAMSTLVLFTLAYGLFAWLLSRQGP